MEHHYTGRRKLWTVLTGTVTCPDSIDDNGIPLTTTITITISAAGIVGAPTANPTAGTYAENQSVTLLLPQKEQRFIILPMEVNQQLPVVYLPEQQHSTQHR